MPLAAMVRSVLDTLAPGRALQLFVVDCGLAPQSRERLARSWSPELSEVNWVTLDAERLKSLPVWGRMSLGTYQRLLMGDFLPASLQRVAWLDCDLIVRADLGGLWDAPMHGATILAAQDLVIPFIGSSFGVAGREEFGISSAAPHFNAGVMLVDLERWRAEDVASRAFDYLERYREEIWFWDQEALNAVLAERWGKLDPRWNQIESVAGRSFFHPEHIDPEAHRQLAADPWIIHYAGSLKPWSSASRTQSRELYFQSLDRTDWRGWRPRGDLRATSLGFYEAFLRRFLYPVEGRILAAQRRRALQSSPRP